MRSTVVAVPLVVSWAGAALADDFEFDPSSPAIEAAQETIRERLVNPWSARFRGVRVMPSGAVCGEVNARNRSGGYGGFTPFAVDRSLNHASVHSILDDHRSRLMRIDAVCDRRPGETLRASRERHAEAKVRRVVARERVACARYRPQPCTEAEMRDRGEPERDQFVWHITGRHPDPTRHGLRMRQPSPPTCRPAIVTCPAPAQAP
jgi:hypothetical protein